MKFRSGEAAAAVLLAAAITLGLLLDGIAGEVTVPASPSDEAPQLAARAAFCPPPAPSATTRISAAAVGERGTIGVGGTDGALSSLEPPNMATVDATSSPLDVVGYGGRAAATASAAFRAPARGVGAAACSHLAAARWFFPGGTTALGYHEHLLLYNPFPYEAVAKVSVFAPRLQPAKANLADVPVPAKGFVPVALNEAIKPSALVGTVVDAVRGRLVAWRVVAAASETSPEGVHFALGATEQSDVWYFPEGVVADDVQQQITLLNPSQEEATVTISLIAAEDAVQPPKLVEIGVPPRSVERIAFADSIKGAQSNLGSVSTIVQSVNGVEIVADRTIAYRTEELEGVTGELGASTPVRRWLLGPAVSAPGSDSVVVMNPSADTATVDLTLLPSRQRSRRPAELQGIEVPAGGRFKIPLAEWTAGSPVAVVVEADLPVVTERVSYSEERSDVAALLGIPL